MKNNGLFDKRAYLTVLGCLIKSPTLLDDIDRPLDRTDFNTETFYELLYIAIYNLHEQGCVVIDEFSIDSYLSNYPEQYNVFQNNDGIKYIVNAIELSKDDNYEYNYHRVRKFSLLRYYEDRGLDTRFIYDWTVADVFKAEKENRKFDQYTEKDIVDMVEATFVINPEMRFCTNTLSTDLQAADGMEALVDELMQVPDIGLPLNNVALNTIARGARYGCVYMRSAIQGGGKSRMLAGDICKIAVPYVWDEVNNEWLYTGISQPAVYFTTEMTPDEIQTIIISAISKVNEDHILNGTYEGNELEKVKQAIAYIKEAPLYIVHIPDFSITDIINLIKKYNRELSVCFFFFDYVHTSLRLMAEINSRSGMGLKEHQLLLVFITELKTIAQQLGVFIFTASQLNGEAQNALYKDQNLLAGAKSLANKLDMGIISMEPTKAELKRLEPILRKSIGMPVPNMAHWVYKVRRGKLTRIIVWTKANLGTMSEEALFVTNYDFELIDVDFTKIEQIEEKIKEHSVLISKVPDEVVEEVIDIEAEEIPIEDEEFVLKPNSW